MSRQSPTPARRLPLRARLRGRHGRLMLWAATLITAFTGGWGLWYGGVVGNGIQAAAERVDSLAVEAGFRIDEVMVVGRDQSDPDRLMRALGIRRGGSILAFDTGAAKARIEGLPWVASASVERVLPATVLVRIEEREPLVLWQDQGRLRLIDTRGEEIATTELERFRDLILVVGPEAPEHAQALLRTLQTEPDLMMRVTAAVWVGGRRWTVRLENGVDVHLPEADPADAWRRLADYQRNHDVLARDVEVLDLRLPDRLIVKRPDRRPAVDTGPERQT